MILEKRAGLEHDAADLDALIQGYVAGEVPDYQLSAWLMAVCWRGMTAAETASLTASMANSGDVLDLSSLPHTVDKHSTGGVGDKTTLVLAPLLASLGATVAKMSGRGLGHTGGTVDKLESIPGFTTDLDDERFMRQAREVGVVVSGQSKDLAPADGLIYSLRDTTGTVESLPLIASSIMSKKLAGGAKSIVLDVKVGSGAFMRELDDARALASAMTAIGRHAGLEIRVIISNMAEPLGMAVGNALEVNEAIACLQGSGPKDLRELCVVLAQEVLAASDLPAARDDIVRALGDGRAFERFERWVAAQGGDVGRLSDLELAPEKAALNVGSAGAIERLDARAIGEAVGLLGGGRAKKGDAIDHGVGVVLHAKIGTMVAAGDAVATVYHRGGRGLDAAMAKLQSAVAVSPTAQKVPLIVETGIT